MSATEYPHSDRPSGWPAYHGAPSLRPHPLMFRHTGLDRLDLQAMFNASPNAYVVMDRALVIVGANAAYLALTHRSLDEIVGRALFDAFPSAPDSPHGQQLRQSFERVLATGRPDHLAAIRYPIVDASGQVGEQVWSATHIPVLDAQGQVSHILQHTENISHLESLRALAQAHDPTLTANILRRAEASQATILSLSNELRLLRGIFEDAPGFTVLLRGPAHVIELANPAYRSLVGERALIGRTVREALPELADQGFFEILDAVYASGRAHVGRSARVRLRPRPGEPLREHHVDFVFQPVRRSDGEVQGIFVQGHDLTAQVAAQRLADSSQRRFETLAHTLPLHVWTARPDGRIDWCNAQVLDDLGMDLATASRTDWLELLHADDRAPTQAAWARSLAEGLPYLNEFRLRMRDGGHRWHLSRATPVRDAEGRVTQWVGSNTDIDDQKASTALLADLNNVLARRVEERTAELVRTQEALRESQQLEGLGRLTGGVAHEFNNLLQVIGGNLQLALRQAGLPAEVGQRLALASQAVLRGAELSRQLLAYGRRQPLQPEVLSLKSLLHSLDILLRKSLGEGVEVRTVLADDLWHTLVDAANVETALLNLVLNARDAMDGHGLLTIEASNAVLDPTYTRDHPDLEAGDYVLIAVSDTGHGMSEEVQARAFEPFFTTKPRGQGSGLGLSTVFGFAKQSGGHVRLYSEPGQGTTVRLYLPRSTGSVPAAPPARGADAEAAAPAARRHGHILVVEDDDAVRDTVVTLLRSLGHGVQQARDGASALALLQAGGPLDLLFTDVVMPGPVSSTELASRARALRPGLRVLFTSGYTENALLHGGRIDPGVQLLSKPYSRETLQRKLDSLLAPDSPAPLRRVLLCEDDALVRESLVELLTDLGCQAQGCGTVAEALHSLGQVLPELLITDLRLPDGDGLALARQARAASPGMLIAIASGRGSEQAAAQVAGAVALAKPFTVDDLEALLARLNTG